MKVSSWAGFNVIESTRFEDERGYFIQPYYKPDYEKSGFDFPIGMMNVSMSRKKGTIRGMHYQLAPFAQTKLVRCIAGSICDVVVDIDPVSPSYLKSWRFILEEDSPTNLLIPPGFAHGFQALTDNAKILYLASGEYKPSHERGVSPFDPALHIQWPVPPTVVSARDKSWPPLKVNE